MIERISDIYLISDKNFNLIHDKVKDNQDLLNSNRMFGKNRSCSYMSFLMKEIYEYHFAKADDGFYFYKLRNLNKETNNLKNLKNILNEKMDFGSL